MLKVRKYYDPGIENQGGDVNEEAAPQVDSQPSPEPEQTADDQSTQTLNEDTSGGQTPEHIPYERFKEVNDKYKSQSEMLEGFEELKKQIQSSDNGTDKWNKFVEDLYGVNENEAPSPEQGTPEPQNEVLSRVERMEAYIQQKDVDGKKQGYINEYQKLENEHLSSESQEYKDFVGEMVAREVGSLSKNKLYQQYNPKLVKAAFDNVNKRLNSVLKGKLGEYADGKSNPTPVNGKGATPSKSQPKTLGSHEKRVSYAKELLRTSKQSQT
jgi:hypothetical protein